MWLVRRAEARALCNGMLPRGLRSGVRGRDETDEDDRNVEALAVEIKDLDKDDPDLHAISLLAGNLGITNGEIWAWVEPTPGHTSLILWHAHHNDIVAVCKFLEEDQSLVHARDYDNHTFLSTPSNTYPFLFHPIVPSASSL
ncbi:hypothetical protein ACFX15_045442 [Malus domestica]